MTRKTISVLVLLLSAVLILMLFVGPAAAQEAGFSETFDDPQLTGWEHSPEVVVREGVLRIAPGNFAARPGAWGNFDLSFKLRLGAAPGETEIHYRATDSGAYMLVFIPERVILIKGGGPGSEPSELASAELGELPIEDWITVRISVSGGQHTVAINDAINLTADDPEPIPIGGVTFASHGERTTELDDVMLAITAGQGEGPVREDIPAQPGQPQVPAAAAPEPTQPEPDPVQRLLQSLSDTQGSTFDIGTFAVNLVLAVIASFILSRVYVFWGASLSNRRKFAANFMLVTVTTTFIILVVRSSVALSLGLVGALSIIRFRAAIKEPEELAYLFFAISLGIGLGDNQRTVTLLTLAVVILVLGLARLLRQSQADVNLHLSVASRAPNKVDMQQVMDALAVYCSKLRLMRYDENAESLEMSFVIEFRHTADLNQARAALRGLSDGLEISFLDNKGIW